MANKTLTARLQLNTTQFESKIKRVAKAIDAINNAIGKQSNAYGAVNSALGKSDDLTDKVSKKTKKTTSETEQWSDALNTVNDKLNSSDSALGKIGSKLKSLVATYLSMQGLKLMVDTSDVLTSAENKLNYVNAQNLGEKGYNKDGTYSSQVFENTEASLGKMYTSSQKVRMSYDDMMSNVAKSVVLCGDAFNNSTDNAIRFQEIMAEAYAIGGATAQEMHTSMYQLIQGMSGNLLAGDELRSVREGAPLAYKEIEKFAQKLYETDESLKDIAADGKITADIVVNAILGAGEKLDTAFTQTEQTFAQTFTQIKNTATRAFDPIAKKMRQLLTQAISAGLLEKFEKFFATIGRLLLWLFETTLKIIGWIANNWNWLQHIIVTVLICMITWTLVKTAISVACTILEIKAYMELAKVQTAVISKFISIAAIIAVIVIGVMALIYVFTLWKQGAIDTCDAIVWALIIIGVTVTIVIAIITGGLSLIPLLVFLGLALILQYLDYFLAIVYSIGAFLYNLVVGIIDGILQYLWHCAEPFIGIIEWILNVCNGGFNSFGGAVANLIGQIISWFLSLGKVVTKIIDAIFGTDWTAGLSSLQDTVLAWGKNENAITISREAPTLESLTGGALPDRISYSSAWNTGMSHGETAKDWINEKGSKFQNMSSALTQPEDEFSHLFDDNPLDYDKSLGNIDNISKDVGEINDKMDLTDEDLEYLRKLAEMEAINKFTTAEIKVDMTNNNNINGEQDLDGIVNYLSDALLEEMNIVAYGIHN